MTKEKVEGVETETEETPEQSAATQKPDKTVPYDRFAQVIAERDEAKARVDAAEKKQKEVQAAILAEQGEYKALYEAQVAEAEKAQSELQNIRAEALKRDAATRAGIPQLWDRIQGQTLEELEADAARLVGALPPSQAPNIDAGTSSGNRSTDVKTKKKMTAAERTYRAGILGVLPQHLPDEEIY